MASWLKTILPWPSFGAGALLGYFWLLFHDGSFYDWNEKGILPDHHSFSLAALLACNATNDLLLCFSRLVMLEDNSKTPALRWLLKNLKSIIKRRKRVLRKRMASKELVLTWFGRKSILFLWSLAPCVLVAMVQLSFGLRGITLWWYHPNHDDHDWLNPLLDSLFVVGDCGLRKSAKPWLYEGFWLQFPDRECQSHILAPIVSGLTRFVLWDGLPIQNMRFWSWCDQRYGSKVEHHFDGNVLDLVWFCGGLWKFPFIYPTEKLQNKLSKKCFSRINRKRGQKSVIR